MEAMTYFTEAELTLDDLLQCLAQTEYTTNIGSYIDPNDVVYIHYKVEWEGKEYQQHCRWKPIRTGIMNFEPEQQKAFLNVINDPKSYFSISYSPVAFDILTEIFKMALDCFGGVIVFEGHFLDRSSIARMTEIASKKW